MRLRYITEGNRWSGHGRRFFLGRVYEFVRRGARVEFCLPAFPCKSSNPEKVVGVVPRPRRAACAREPPLVWRGHRGIYEPGAKLWIVSDGHVFSDCSELSSFRFPLPPALSFRER
jgi:pyoverdine/dityrosine biosynthesis protein Dit1